jgi:hypothetical protein
MLACRRQYPIEDLVSAIRPRVVLSCVLHAVAGGELVARWGIGHSGPLVFTWQGRTGQNAQGERIQDWAPKVAQQVRESQRSIGKS